jgi:hypothetical protein
MIAKAADALGAEIGELLSSAREYHIQQRDIAVEENLKIVLQDLSARTSLLSDVCDDNAELSLCRSGVLAVKKAITGSHFEDEHDGALSASAQQIQVITAEILRAKRYFLQLKHKQFPRK